MGNIVNHNYDSGLIYFKLLQVKYKMDSKKFKQKASTNNLLNLKTKFYVFIYVSTLRKSAVGEAEKLPNLPSHL